jgi:hypothetical protein
MFSTWSLQEFFKFLSENTGLNPVNLTNVWRIQDTLFVEVHLFVVSVLAGIPPEQNPNRVLNDIPGIPHTLAKLAIYYCVLNFGY